MMQSTQDNKDSLPSKADAAFRQAARKVVQKAMLTGTPVIIWEDGQIKEIPAAEMEARLAAR
jgi:hypothetical protein